MNKKLSVFAVVLVVVGIIGTVVSGIYSVPYFINEIEDFNKEVNKQSIIYDANIDVNNLDINTNNVNVYIEKSDTNKVFIKTEGLYENVDFKIENKENTLSIEEVNNRKSTNIKNMNDLISLIRSEVFSNQSNKITVYVPNDMNLNINTKGGDLIVVDDVFLENLTFTTYYGYIEIPDGVKDLEVLNISTNRTLSMEVSKLLGIKNVNMDAVDVYITNNGQNQEMIQYLPEKLVINSDKLGSGDILISSNTPVSKELIIDAYNSRVELDLRLDKYKYDFNIIANSNIDLNDYLVNNVFNNSMVDEVKEFNKVINEDLQDTYKVDINCNFLDFE